MAASHNNIKEISHNTIRDFSPLLLAWYDSHARLLPWRVDPKRSMSGVKGNPYHVWLSEVMLQQTTVEAVKPYFAKFLSKWPTVEALAKAPRDDVMSAWAGLGYYARARNLKACAQMICDDHGGNFPTTQTQLLKLPGIGDYTSAAIAAIAFGQDAIVVDGNVERVISRFFTISTPLPKAKIEIKAIVGQLLDKERPGDFAQAMMDLGATVCTPKRPHCLTCPLRDNCQALSNVEDPQIYPVKAPKKVKPVRYGAAFLIENQNQEILLVRRPDTGMLGGMSCLPTTNWGVNGDGDTTLQSAPFDAPWRDIGIVTHVFTHFELRLNIWHASIEGQIPFDHGSYTSIDEMQDQALPTLMRKAISLRFPTAFKKGAPK